MKKFNQEINFSISVDYVAEMLLNNMAPDAKHRELIVETLIGRMLATDIDGIGMLATSIMGIKRNLNFSINEEVMCDEKYYRHDTKEYIKYGKCVISEIKEYADVPIRVKFKSLVMEKGDLVEKERESWVSLNTITKIPIQ